VNTIGNEAFSNCNNLTSVNIQGGNIGVSSFAGCTNLTSVTIGNNTSTIGDSAFQGTGIISITIPDTVTSIGTDSFNCPNLLSVTLEGNTNLNNSFGTTVTNLCIKGDNRPYVGQFNNLTLLVYNKDFPNGFTGVPTIAIDTNATIVPSNNSISIGKLCDPQPNAPILLGKYHNDTIQSDFTTDVDFPLTLDPTKSYFCNFTVSHGDLIIVSMPIRFIQTSSIISVVTDNFETDNTSGWTKNILSLFENLLQLTLLNKIISVQKLPTTVFANVSPTYTDIDNIYAFPYASVMDLSNLNYGSRILLLLNTTPNSINVGGVTISSDGTDTFFDGVLWILGTIKTIGNYVLTLFANGSSFITVEYLEPPVPPVPPVPVTPVTSNICFPAGTPVLTDQGYIPIDKITTQTLGNKPIQLTKTISSDKYLVCFEKDALAKNVPFQRTWISKDHKVYFKEYSLKAKDMVPYFEKVYKVKYTGEVLYNVLVDTHSQMKVNNMICETLDPKHYMAQLVNLTKKEQENKIHVWKKEEKSKKQLVFK